MKIITDPETKRLLDEADVDVRKAESALSDARLRRKELRERMADNLVIHF